MTLIPNSLAARDVAYHLHSYTDAVKHEQEGPLVLTRGKGVHVYDENGREYLEAIAGLWCTSLGYDEPRLVEAAVAQLRKLPFYHTFGGRVAEPAVELAERLIKLAPVPMSHAFFANSGSEANDSVVKLVWYFNNAIGRPQKKKIISRIKGYHGVTIAAASMTGLPNNHRDFDLPIAGILHADCPHHYRFAQPGESEEQFASRLADNLEKQILAEGPETVAAFIAEPVMGAGGVLVPPRGYFEKIQPILRKHDLLFIADEVICGFGRTGNMWGSQTFNLQPDIITCAKALSSSYLPISAVLMNQRVYEGIRENSGKIGVFSHGFTYSGHPVAAAVAVEALKIYEERKIVDQVRRVAPALQNGLRRFADHPIVGEVRGVGLVAAVELVKDKATKESFDPALGVGAYMIRRAQDHGLLTRPLGDTFAFCPPLIITEAQIGDLLARFGRTLDDTYGWVRERNLVKAA